MTANAMVLHEFTEWTGEPPKPETPGTLKNVLVLGAKSRNKREYAPAAMRQAVPLYEGTSVFVDHPSGADKERKGRAAADRFGKLLNVHFSEANGGEIRGDLAFLESHPLAPRVAEDLKRDLKLFGLSHLADGSGHIQKGITMVESIDKVMEVDLVTNPATALSLREQTDVIAAPTEPTEEQKKEQKREDAARQAENALTQAIGAVLADPDQNAESKQLKISELVATHFKQFEEEPAKEPEKEPAKEEKKEEVKEQTVIDLSEQIKLAVSEAVAPFKAEIAELKKRPAFKFLQPATAPTDKPREPLSLSEQEIPFPANGTPAEKARWLKSH